MKDNIILISVIITMGIGIVGCTTTSSYKAGEQVSLEVAAVLKFSDIPIPTGFNLLSNESFAFQNNQLRIALLKYIGKSHPENISKFYQDQMPLYNWGLINIVEYGNNVLNFQRENEVCTITINPEGSKSLVVISVTPKANSGSSYTDKKLVK